MVKGIAQEELDLEILEFLDSLSNAGVRIPAKHVVKKEILQEQAVRWTMARPSGRAFPRAPDQTLNF